MGIPLYSAITMRHELASYVASYSHHYVIVNSTHIPYMLSR